MFRNLKAEMARKGLLSKDLAAILNITDKSMTNKMCGKTEFTRKEMIELKNKEFPNCSLDYLFEIADAADKRSESVDGADVPKELGGEKNGRNN